MEIYDSNGNVIYDDLYSTKIKSSPEWILKDPSTVITDRNFKGFVNITNRVLELFSHSNEECKSNIISYDLCFVDKVKHLMGYFGYLSGIEYYTYIFDNPDVASRMIYCDDTGNPVKMSPPIYVLLSLPENLNLLIDIEIDLGLLKEDTDDSVG